MFDVVLAATEAKLARLRSPLEQALRPSLCERGRLLTVDGTPASLSSRSSTVLGDRVEQAEREWPPGGPHALLHTAPPVLRTSAPLSQRQRTAALQPLLVRQSLAEQRCPGREPAGQSSVARQSSPLVRASRVATSDRLSAIATGPVLPSCGPLDAQYRTEGAVNTRHDEAQRAARSRRDTPRVGMWAVPYFIQVSAALPTTRELMRAEATAPKAGRPLPQKQPVSSTGYPLLSVACNSSQT